MASRNASRNITSIFLMSAFLFAAPPAFAGFQWKGAAPVKAASAPPASGQVIWEDAIPAPVMPAEKVEKVESNPMALVPAYHMTEEKQESAAAAPSSEEILSGFGKDLPLVIALQQIVPPGYQYSFVGGAAPGVQVSWEGGKPWQSVLEDMLKDTGFVYRLQNNIVVISKSASLPPIKEEPAVSIAPPMQKPEAVIVPPEKTLVIRREKPSDLLPPPPLPLTEAAAMPLHAAEALPQEKTAFTPAPEWRALQGQTLRDVLASWARAAGVELYWSIDYDYRINQDMAFNGTFDEAVATLLDGYAAARPQPYGQLHQSADGPRVLVVNSYDLTN